MTTSHLKATPRLARLLNTLGRRLRVLLAVRGVGTLLAAIGGWVAFMFLADYVLRVPSAIRVLHVGVLVGLIAWVGWRALLRPLRRVPGEEGLSLLLERRHPELRQVLISAVQFQRAGDRLDPRSAPLVERVLERAEESAARLDAAEVTDTREARDRALLGVFAVAVVLSFALWQPGLTRIFLNHAVLGSEPWPKRTELVLELPGLGPGARLSEEGSVRRLLLARGSDLALAVRANGVVPGVVTLHVDSERIELTRSAGPVFRTVLRSLDSPVTVWATGGDDLEGTGRLVIEVLQPPDVAGIAMAVEPPAYTGLAPTTRFDQDVEVPAGSRVRVHVLALAGGSVGGEVDASSLTGFARILPSDERIELVPAPYPAREGDGSPEMPGRRAFRFELTVDDPTSFRIELADGTGLENPDPGLHWIRVRRDRAPELTVLAPARSEFTAVEGGAIPLRVRVRDDYGIGEVRLSVARTSDPEGPVEILREAFRLVPLAEPGGESGRSALALRLMEVSELGTDAQPVEVDQRYLFELVASDRREPTANESKAPAIRARIVAPEELLRRMQERLARARLDALELSDLQRQKRDRVEELVGALDSDDAPQSGSEAVSLAAALSGQRRVLGDAETLVRALASTAEDILYARLDENGAPLLDRYDALVSRNAELSFDAEPWRVLSREMASGALPTSGFAANLCRLVGMGIAITDGPASTAARELDAAERALEPTERLDALMRAAESQTASLEAIDALLDELAEWDNFQNVLSLTRDLVNRQKALRERTQRFAAEK